MPVQKTEERAFDVIPFEDIKGNWKKLGSGSFGNVYKGTYLGIDVAIKEVLPSKEYDVSKYFEREWRLMKEARHPNVVLYLGLSRAPPPDNRIFIISEFIENGNLRGYIYEKSKPFPWRLRLSFATDIARALAYLHARRCIHRDLKGENLLVTANGRLKITDFGFARIAARSEEESKRLTFCGTDSYMSPEILIGNEFDLPTDIFSLGVILCEISSRKLADDNTFRRTAPYYTIDEAEVRMLANPDCPPSFLELAFDCLSADPAKRPTMVTILSRLREIELEVLARPTESDDVHVGSVKFVTASKRPGAGPRIPSFGMDVGKDIRTNGDKKDTYAHSSDEDSDEDDELELADAIKRLDFESAWNRADSGTSKRPLLNNNSSDSSAASSSSVPSDYSTTVIRTHSPQATNTVPPSLSSILTIRSAIEEVESTNKTPKQAATELPTMPSSISVASGQTYHTAPSVSSISTAAATEGGSTIRLAPIPSAFVHRFTLIKPGARRLGATAQHKSTPERNGYNSHDGPGSANASPSSSNGISAGPFDFFFSSGLVAKCDLCSKRLGFKPCLECDDCGLRAHIKCGEVAPIDCGIRPVRQRVTQTLFIPISPLSNKVKQQHGKNAVGSPR